MKNYVISELLNSDGLLTCPICKKEFKPNEDTNYIVTGGYTCSWKCFWTSVKIREKQKVKDRQKKEQEKQKKKSKRTK